MKARQPSSLMRAKIEDKHFFLPNFCTINSIFLLFIGAELISLVLILATGDVLSESWDELGLLSIFVQWIVLGSAGFLCLIRRGLAQLSLPIAAFCAYLSIVLITALMATCAQYFLLHIDYQWGSTPETIQEFVLRCVSISAILALVVLRYFYVRQQWRRRIQLESQARIEALQARIRPHFLFNSMNIIASLIQTEPVLAEQAVEDLAEIFRATLKESGSMVPLSEEWHLCRNYLRIEGLRLGQRLQVDADLSSVPQDASIPMLTLQPLVENAIYHGIQPIESGGVVKVSGDMEGNMLCIQISNPIPPPTQKRPPKGNQVALENIRHRLNLLFGNQAKLKLKETSGVYYATVFFPYVKVGL